LPDGGPHGDVRTIAENNVIVTGGCITSMLLGEKINDYDFYLKTRDAVKTLASHYVEDFNRRKGALKTMGRIPNCNPEVRLMNKENIRGEMETRVMIYMKSSGAAGEGQSEYSYFESRPEVESSEFLNSFKIDEEKLEVAETMLSDLDKKKKPYDPVFFSENAISLRDKTQLIIRFHGNVEEIHKNFDFAHTHCSYDYARGKLVLPSESLQAMLSKTLIYRGSLYPVSSVFRCRKFLDRGWRITAGQMLKMCHQISQIDLGNSSVLQEQLVGVDAAYMHELIVALKKTEGRIDATYLAKLIDQIFE